MAIQINGNGTITGISVGGLPDGIVDTDMIANSAVTSAKSSGLGGLSMVQQWGISTSGGEFTPGSGTDLNTGWYIQSQAGAGNIGSSMTQSSGVFTFPSTGIYSILFICAFYNTNGSGDRSHFAHIKTSTDGGSNYIVSSYNGTNTSARGGTTHANTYGQLIFDVTNTSTHKVKFHVESTHSGSRVYTSPGDRNYTNVIFQKLGDT